MERKQEVSKAVIQRLPRYYRNICELKAEGEQRISSKALAERMGLTASQIRQDFNCFGGFGRQGYGYSVPELREHIGKILGLDHVHSMIISSHLSAAFTKSWFYLLPARLHALIQKTDVSFQSACTQNAGFMK